MRDLEHWAQQILFFEVLLGKGVSALVTYRIEKGVDIEPTFFDRERFPRRAPPATKLPSVKDAVIVSCDSLIQGARLLMAGAPTLVPPFSASPLGRVSRQYTKCEGLPANSMSVYPTCVKPGASYFSTWHRITGAAVILL